MAGSSESRDARVNRSAKVAITTAFSKRSPFVADSCLLKCLPGRVTREKIVQMANHEILQTPDVSVENLS
jgi:hypothetical protein